MDSTSFWRFSCANLLFVFLSLLFLGTCHILFRECWDFLWVFILYFLYLILDQHVHVTTEIRFFAVNNKKDEKVLDRGQNGFNIGSRVKCRGETHRDTVPNTLIISIAVQGHLIITILPVGTKDLPISPRFTPYHFLSRCKFSTLTTRQPMVEFYLLTFPRFPLRKKEHKSYFGKNRTHDFRTSRCAAYLLDHSGDNTIYCIIYCIMYYICLYYICDSRMRSKR